MLFSFFLLIFLFTSSLVSSSPVIDRVTGCDDRRALLTIIGRDFPLSLVGSEIFVDDEKCESPIFQAPGEIICQAAQEFQTCAKFSNLTVKLTDQILNYSQIPRQPAHQLIPDFADIPVIYGIRGCVDSGNTTTSCDVFDTLTIYGANFENTVAITIRSIRADVGLDWSPSLITVQIPGYLFFPNQLLEVIVFRSDGAQSSPFAGVSIITIVPQISKVSGCRDVGVTTTGCRPFDNLTIFGVNFFYPLRPTNESAGIFPAIVYARDANNSQSLLPCSPISMNRTSLVCQLPYYRLNNPNNLNSVQIWFESFAAIGTNSFRGVTLADSPLTFSSSSSSTGGSSAPTPQITRISGCEDFSSMTLNCPTKIDSLTLTMYGRDFFLNFAHLTYGLVIDNTQIKAEFTFYPNYFPNYLTVEINPATLEALTKGKLLNVSLTWNLTHSGDRGKFTTINAINITNERQLPIITSVTGCSDTFDKSRTENCHLGDWIRLTGKHFALYDEAFIYFTAAAPYDMTCTKRFEYPGDLWCRLPQFLPHGIIAGSLLDITLAYQFSRMITIFHQALSFERIPTPRSSSSTGSASSGVVVDDGDGLDGMKYSLMILMLIALGILVIASAVYLTTWYHAQRRAFVSSNGSAAIDMRQVLLY